MTAQEELNEFLRECSRLYPGYLDVLLRLLRSQIEGPWIEPSPFTEGAIGLVLKVYSHCWTIGQLISNHSVRVPMHSELRIDVGSYFVLQRVIVEAYLVLFEVFLELPMSDPEAEFRRLVWRLKGLAPLEELFRTHVDRVAPELYPDRYARAEEFEQKLEHTIELLGSNRYFRSLPAKTQRDILRLAKNHNFSRLKYNERNSAARYLAAGLGPTGYSYYYNRQSSYIHSDLHSIFTVSTLALDRLATNEREVTETLNVELNIPLEVLAQTIVRISKYSLSPKESQDQLEAYRLAEHLLTILTRS